MQIRQWISMFMVVFVSVALLFFNAGDVMALKVGDKAPDFTLPSTTGENISLSQFQGSSISLPLVGRERTMRGPSNRTIPSSRRPTLRYWASALI